MSQFRPTFPVVGIGASAGGVEALGGFFRGVPKDSGCAFVVVTHMPPDHRTLLPDILARHTDMPVHVAVHDADLKPNEVHVLPSDAILRIAEGRLQIEKPPASRREKKPIDIFLSELARDLGEYAVGVVLSGSDGDGALGVKAIKEHGGLTLAQTADGTAPKYSDMPNSAIATGMVDLAIPVGEMGGRIIQFARSFEMLDQMADSRKAPSETRAFDAVRDDIYSILRNQIGHDFSGYKEKTFLRRVHRRMQINQIENPESYVERLRQDSNEVGALFRDLLINVTNFFRDADAFEMLAKSIIPKIFANRGADDTVRAWVPACSTGEEVYSIAILMREHMDTLTAVPRVQIFATDIDEPALSVARAARYPAALLESVSPERRARFFTADGGSYVLTKDVRELCIFSPHSVIRDPPFSRLDLVSCRNLLIYFGPDMQNQVIPTFHYALKPGGYMFLGTSENASQFSDLFAPVDKKSRIFKSREDAVAHVRVPLAVGSATTSTFAVPTDRKVLAGTAFRQTVETQVLERFSPPHVVVTRDGDVVYYSSRTGKYLEATSGAPSRQILALARKGLRLDLRAVLREAIESETRAVREDIAVEFDEGRVQLVTLSVEPLKVRDDGERLYLVVFADVGPALSREQASHRVAPDENSLQLEQELRDTRERLQSLIEEYETALEELKSSNEELVSVNEESQSTNEELEASKEELQSLNEELHTVNAELSAKVEALDQANNDLTNLFDSTRVATVFLDKDLVIRNYTPAVSQIFNIRAGDRGRPLTDLAARISLPGLAEDVRAVLRTGQMLERTIEHGESAAHFLLRLAPYRDAARAIEGAVLTFIDVTTLRKAEAHHRVLIAELNHRVKNMLTVVIGIAEQTYRTTTETKDFKDRLVGRVRAMAESYELLSQQNWIGAPIGALVTSHLAPFGPERVHASGADLHLKPRQALSLGMIIHELATNAGKYGALGAENGRLDLEWSELKGDISFAWKESGGPRVTKPTKTGFGLKLIEQETAYGLGGAADIQFLETGLTAGLRFPQQKDDDAIS